MAVDRPPFLAELLENPAVLNPTCARAEMIIEEISREVAGRERSNSVPFLIRRGNSCSDCKERSCQSVAEWTWLYAQALHGLLGLSEEVVALVLGHPNTSLMTVPELVVLPDFDVVSCAIGKLQPAADKEVKAPPDVTRQEQAELRAATASERGSGSSQTVEPVMEEGPTDRTALPRALWVTKCCCLTLAHGGWGCRDKVRGRQTANL